ncbi:MAG: KpsF/GutQ family sugar-phosphate isomerase [Micavibrio aeruginosavorus]|uniref:KpsF/GutQ family sugar-phosphate isomerase n=1 Tax=Micavibrio aeruginosavorus TaxID=349221 RepID=A0A2W5N036_9BACT|nr:MAG: KpsF/GutQ family sugar-phosphate isomerase [Micavibrio aeruginosavorus]
MSISSPTKRANTMNSDLETGRNAILTEMNGLKALADSLDENFVKAIEAIHKMKTERRARLIVAGIGKSGHVGKKITATLASTGTPAHFVHPNEASHGDLGMISEGDVVLLLSNSGGSSELSDLIHYTRRFGITLIAMTSKPESPLGQHADIILQLPKAAEACPNGLAPTTSTTMQLALGDAIAVALLEKMGLTPEQFSIFHPGGKLGQKLLTVAGVMQPFDKLALLPETAKMDEVIVQLTEKNLGCVLIMNDKKLLGIVTDGDLKRHMAPDLLQKPASEIMTKTPKTIDASALAVEAMNVMTKTEGRYLTSLVVLDGAGDVKGLIRLQDCLQRGVA